LTLIFYTSLFNTAIATASEIQSNQATAFPENPIASSLTIEAVLISIGFSIIALLITVVGYFAKKQLDDIIETIKSFSDRQSDCRETLHQRFADKDATDRDIKDLERITDRHEAILQRHGVLIGGRRVDDA